MGIIHPFMQKTVLGNTDLTLEAKSGESLRVLDVQVYNPTLEKYANLSIEKTTVGYFRTSGLLGGHLPFVNIAGQHSHDLISSGSALASVVQEFIRDANGVDSVETGMTLEVGGSAGQVAKRFAQFSKNGTPPKTILAFLREKGLFDGYPVESGQVFKISGVAEANAIQVVTYEVGDAGDFSRSMPNGSEASDYIFLNYGRVANALTIAGSTVYNTLQSPDEFPAFPFASDVPARTKINLYGILASPIVDYDAADDFTATQYLKLIKERMTLFDDDKNGILNYGIAVADTAQSIVGEGFGYFGNYSDVDGRLPLMFDNPLEFLSGEELNIYATVIQGANAGSISTLLSEIALIERITKVG